MDNPKNGGFATAAELRKQLLITQGAMFRSGIVVSKEAVMTGLRANTLAQSAIRQIGLAALNELRSPSGLTGSVAALAPLLFGGISNLWRQPNRKLLVRGGIVVAGAVAATVATIFFKRRSKQAENETEAKTAED